MSSFPIASILLAASPAWADDAPATVTVGGYVEVHYQLHAQDPSNRITSLRGFDDRSRTLTLQNVALELSGVRGRVTTRMILQTGHTAAASYLAEPALPGGPGVAPSDATLWRLLQTATIAVAAPGALVIEAGLFASPIGPEVLAVKDNWSWSRSELCFGLPFYHTGARVSRGLGGGWTATAAIYNGWNSVTDNNGTPSLALSAAHADGDQLAQLLYFGGIERPPGAPEGTPWRHLVDAYLRQPITKTLSVLAQVDAGAERTRFGTSAWAAGALSGKLALSPTVYVAARADAFYERVARGAAPIFWPTRWIGSGTLTIAYQPVPVLSVRVELRHDQAADDVFFGGEVEGDGVTSPFVFDRDHQDTLTVGATAWF